MKTSYTENKDTARLFHDLTAILRRSVRVACARIHDAETIAASFGLLSDKSTYHTAIITALIELEKRDGTVTCKNGLYYSAAGCTDDDLLTAIETWKITYGSLLYEIYEIVCCAGVSGIRQYDITANTGFWLTREHVEEPTSQENFRWHIDHMLKQLIYRGMIACVDSVYYDTEYVGSASEVKGGFIYAIDTNAYREVVPGVFKRMYKVGMSKYNADKLNKLHRRYVAPYGSGAYIYALYYVEDRRSAEKMVHALFYHARDEREHELFLDLTLDEIHLAFEKARICFNGWQHDERQLNKLEYDPN